MNNTKKTVAQQQAIVYSWENGRKRQKLARNLTPK
jgi:hypothetical protein